MPLVGLHHWCAGGHGQRIRIVFQLHPDVHVLNEQKKTTSTTLCVWEGRGWVEGEMGREGRERREIEGTYVY